MAPDQACPTSLTLLEAGFIYDDAVVCALGNWGDDAFAHRVYAPDFYAGWDVHTLFSCIYGQVGSGGQHATPYGVPVWEDDGEFV